MKILQCNKFFFPCGGPERYLFDLNEGLTALGHTVINFSTINKRNIPSPYSDYFVSQMDFSNYSNENILENIRNGFNFMYSYEAKKKLTQLIDHYEPDIAHIHNIYHHLSSSVLDALYCKNIPIVMTMHDYKLVCPNYSLFTRNKPCERCKGYRYWNAIRYKCLKDSFWASTIACIETYFCSIMKKYDRAIDYFIAPSQFIANKMIEFGISGKKITVIPPAINLEKFKATGRDGTYVLYFGKLYQKKGVDTLLDSAKQIPWIKFKIVGDGSYEYPLKERLRNEGIKNVELLGFISTNDIVDYIDNALIIVIPSLWYEVMGLTIYETFAVSKCVLAARSGGIPEQIRDGVNGILFTPGDHQDLTNKIKYLVSSPEKRKELGNNGRTWLHRVNNRIDHYKTLLKLYSTAMNNHTETISTV